MPPSPDTGLKGRIRFPQVGGGWGGEGVSGGENVQQRHPARKAQHMRGVPGGWLGENLGHVKWSRDRSG